METLCEMPFLAPATVYLISVSEIVGKQKSAVAPVYFVI